MTKTMFVALQLQRCDDLLQSKPNKFRFPIEFVHTPLPLIHYRLSSIFIFVNILIVFTN